MPDNNPSGLIGWPDEARLYVLKRAREAVSATQIAREVGQKFGIKKSRNAVIGIVHRAGKCLAGGKDAQKLQGRAKGRINAAILRARSPIHVARHLAPRIAPLLARHQAPLPMPAKDDIARKTFEELEDHHCRWIPGNPTGPFEKQFCGLTKVPGTAYCMRHAMRAYEPPKPRRRALEFRGAPGAFDKTKGLNEFESA